MIKMKSSTLNSNTGKSNVSRSELFKPGLFKWGAFKPGLLKSEAFKSLTLSKLALALSPVALIAACQTVPTQPLELSQVQKEDYAAHWVSQNTLLLNRAVDKAWLLSSSSASIDDKSAEQHIALTPVDVPEAIKTQYPHLAQFHGYRVNVSAKEAKQLLKQQLAVATSLNAQSGSNVDTSTDANTNTGNMGNVAHLSYVQHYGVLDDLYTSGNNDADELRYGAMVDDAARSVTFRVWAPLAKQAYVVLYDTNKTRIKRMALKEDSASGAWSLTTHVAAPGQYYRYELHQYHYASKQNEVIEVTDPYSLSLSRNSLYSQVVDLKADASAPKGWFAHQAPALASPESQIIYETHIRDFSAAETALSNEAYRGKYKAFLETKSHGGKHLAALRAAGLNTIHLLPTYDIGTVNEDPNQVIHLSDTLGKACALVPDLSLCHEKASYQTSLEEMLQRFDSTSASAQGVIEQIREHDPYNWGYDPYHYTVPEGSYAVDPEGVKRIIEFREMVQALHEQGFRVVMDVVYNHTYEAGLEPKSVLDKVVPQYYHRLNPISGSIEQSTCCDNTATEHRMMAKLMIDSLVVWAEDYKIDGFRFDLMGHQPKSAMLAAREAVRAVDEDTYFYGEGWNFGEVANHAQFEQASQTALAGSEIGTFTDRLRDAVRGGSSFVNGHALRQGQGLGNGLKVYSNELQAELGETAVQQEYLLSMEQASVGLAGNLANYPLARADGTTVLGKAVPYGGAPTGYALDPADTINYVSKHDNQTLWDNNQYRMPLDATPEERAAFQLVSLAFPLYAQGIPFLHMGSELLRSKSYLRDSYDYGDWFNRVDYSMKSNNAKKGLPPSVKDKANWALIRELEQNSKGNDNVDTALIQSTRDRFFDMLKVRSSSPLFSLQTQDDILARVKFHHGAKKDGLIVMSIDDSVPLENIDSKVEQILIIFNLNREAVTLPVKGVNRYQMHPALSSNPHTPRVGLFMGDVVRAPALSASVLIIPEKRRLN